MAHYNVKMHFLITGRVLTGLASGVITVVCPLYIAETATKEKRGMLGSGMLFKDSSDNYT